MPLGVRGEIGLTEVRRFVDHAAILQSQRTGWPGSKPYNAANCALYHTGKKPYLEYSAYCHGTVSMNGLWLWGIGWAIVALVIGFVFFWQAETRYGRG